MAELDIIASELLKSANEADKNYAKTRDQSQRDKATRLRVIVQNLKTLTLGASDLNGLSDVTLTSVTNGQILLYDGATEQWINGSAGGGGDMLKSTYDVDNTGVVDNAEAISIIGRNSTGATLYKGTIVYISGSTGNRPNFAKAQANAEATSAGTFGVVKSDIANNSDGFVTTVGYLDNLDTRTTATHPFTDVTLADGDTVYLHPTVAGYITNVKPSAPNHIVYVGKVTRTSPTNGTIVYRIQNGYELDEIHDVAISSKANNDLLVYESATTLWKNKSISTIFGGTPLVSVPTLDQVTTAGNTTANSIVIGSSSAITASPYTLQVVGGAGGSAIFSNSAKTQGLNINLTTAGETRIYGDYFGAGVDQKLILGTFANRATQVVLQTSGNVSIGTTTDAGYKLDVNGTARIATSLTVSTAGSGSMNTYLGGSVAIGNDFVNNGYILQIKSVNTGIAGIYLRAGGAGGYPILFCQDANGTASTTFIVRETGNVAIGTTTAVAKFTVTGSITAASLLAQGVYFNNTLVAAANNDVLVGLDINPTFTNGAFTGVSNLALRVAYVAGRYISFTQRPGYADYGRIQFTNVTGADIYSSGRIDLIPSDTDQSVGLGNNLTSRRLASSTNYGLYGPTPPGFQVGTNAAFAVLSNNFDVNTDSFVFSGPTGGRHFFKVVQNNVPYFTIMPTGNVLVNTTTDSGYKLDVSGTVRFTHGLTIDYLGAKIGGVTLALSSQAGGTISSAASAGNNAGPYITLSGPAYLNPTAGNSGMFSITGLYYASSGTAIFNHLNLAPTINNSGTYSGIVRGIYYNPTLTSLTGTTHRAIETTSGDVIFNGGNVGVGTSSPSYPFHISSAAAANIYGTVQSTNANGTAAWVAFNDQSDNVVYRVFGSTASGTQMGIALARSASLMANLGGSGKFLLGTYSNTDFVMGTGNAEKMRIVDSTGNILIATTTDLGNKLEVNGNINSTGYKINNTAGYTGTLVIVTNPPGQQNIDIRGGIIVNVF